jgi:hypothetical protein
MRRSLASADAAVHGRRSNLRSAALKTRAIVILLAAALSSCATKLTPEQRNQIRTMGVISLLGDQIALTHETMFLGGIQDKVPAPGIGFDTVAESSVMECAKAADPGLSFEIIDIAKMPLIEKLDSGPLYAYNATMWRIRPAIADWAKQHPVDAIAIVHEIWGQVPDGPSTYFGGVGLHKFLDHPTMLIGMFGVRIWDGKTLDEIARFSTGYSPGLTTLSPEDVYATYKTGGRLPALEETLKALVTKHVCDETKAIIT